MYYQYVRFTRRRDWWRVINDVPCMKYWQWVIGNDVIVWRHWIRTREYRAKIPPEWGALWTSSVCGWVCRSVIIINISILHNSILLGLIVCFTIWVLQWHLRLFNYTKETWDRRNIFYSTKLEIEGVIFIKTRFDCCFVSLLQYVYMNFKSVIF